MSTHAILRWFYYRIPPRGRLVLRRLYYLPGDLFAKRDAMIPPKGMIFIGSGDFVEQGKLQRETILRHTGMQPDAAVLDVGSGIGRLAVAMTDYLNADGRFEGFDLVKKGVNWCQKHITPKYPNFIFKHVDLKNDLYNLSTETSAKDFIFPYEDNQFDVVTLFSVFSHMVPEDINNYLSEIYRVLKKGGYCVATFFILDEEAKQNIEAGRTGEFSFKYRHDGYAYLDEKVKEANVAYDPECLSSMITNSKLQMVCMEPGRWSDPHRKTDQFQDLIILQKM
ncbi:class I SAM-dependent methyltransferase [Tannerella forsythia]|uniref:Class I SAM-dependent methyltransferase n=1 Tax=Tannerella forsythia TaxID=28112 RepID=A0A3P1XTF0_TANFO|nr:class I SAM-dependent methyltransferase [Tannerella forsythia]RRD60183.1 class I SAM-dependent methyltransferase [Tannerella forsythia]